MALPVPYYQDDWATIYHGDCREVLAEMEDKSMDLVLTDPPYPKMKGGLNITFDRGVAKRSQDSLTVGVPWGGDITSGLKEGWRIARRGMFVFCSYHALSEIPLMIGSEPIALVTWFKRNSPPSMNNAPYFQTEFIWTFKKAPGLWWRKLRTMYDIPKPQAGCMAQERIVHNGKSLHPTQKPLALIQALLAVGGECVLDPYMGTGTTLRAAKDLNRRSIGIEISEQYCEIAARRLQQEVFDFSEVKEATQ